MSASVSIPSRKSSTHREHGEGSVVGQYVRDGVDLRADSLGDPPAVAVGGLDAALIVDGADAVPGRHRLGDDVPTIDDREPLSGKERGPIGYQLRPAVVQDGPERMVILDRRAGAQGQVGEADVAARAQYPAQLTDEPVFVPLADADVACGLEADDGVEGGVRKLERPGVASCDVHPARHPTLLDQSPSLPHLFPADVDPGDVAAAALGDTQRRRADATANVEHALSGL